MDSNKCILGALVGDAAGATLEFCHRTITEEMAETAITMPGGGTIRTGPGQITDDGELALSLLRALESPRENMNEYPFIDAMKSYAAWYNSMPFDIGQTCSLAFQTAFDYIQLYGADNMYEDSINEYLSDVFDENRESEANGALMRVSAIPTWSVKRDIPCKYAVIMAVNDAQMSHPNKVCQEVNAIYVFACYHLLKGYNPAKVLELTTDFVNREIGQEKVQKWFFEESLSIDSMNCTKCIGHVRHAFVLAMYFLRNPDIIYEDAIKITLMKGGDTDTNAAIVGGLVACYQRIPDSMLQPILDFDSPLVLSRNEGHNRPEDYCPKYVLSRLGYDM